MRSLPLPYHRIRSGFLLTLCCGFCQCVQTYVSPYKSPPTGYLVAEGYLSANTPTQYSLTRVIGLPGDSTIPVVTSAIVQVEGSDSSVYALPEQGKGVYGDTTLPLNPALQYRLRIHTPNGEDYLSDFVPVRVTPPIDSVNWIYSPRNGVNIYVNTHDPNNATHYYRWTYDQTWQYNSAEISSYLYDPAHDTVLPRQPDQYVYTCWKDVLSSAITLGNTSKLSQDIVYEYPLVNIPNNSWEISVLYSIQVTQFALTAEGSQYLIQLQTNTESLGSIMDILPTQLTGNIHCLTNPVEPVIGFISAGTVQQQRIFISYYQMPFWDYEISCYGNDYLVPNNPDSLAYYFGFGGLTPLVQTVGGYTGNLTNCVDCRSLGGSTKKPTYWPN